MSSARRRRLFWSVLLGGFWLSLGFVFGVIVGSVRVLS